MFVDTLGRKELVSPGTLGNIVAPGRNAQPGSESAAPKPNTIYFKKESWETLAPEKQSSSLSKHPINENLLAPSPLIGMCHKIWGPEKESSWLSYSPGVWPQRSTHQDRRRLRVKL